MIKLKPGEIIPLTDDDMFTEVFNNEANMCVIEEFISTYFNYPLKDIKGNIKIMPRKLTRNRAKEKSKEVDLFLKYNDKNINIEMTTGWNQHIKDRNVIFLSNIHGRQLNKGNKYIKIDESIQLNFCSFKCKGRTREKYYLKNQFGDVFTEKFRIDIVYMDELKNMCYNDDREMNILIGWSKVFKSLTRKELNDNLKNLISISSSRQLIYDVSRLSGDEEMVKKYAGKTKWEATKETVEYEFKKRRELMDEREKELDEKESKLDEKESKLDEKESKLDEEIKKLDEYKKMLEKKEMELLKKNIM